MLLRFWYNTWSRIQRVFMWASGERACTRFHLFAQTHQQGIMFNTKAGADIMFYFIQLGRKPMNYKRNKTTTTYFIYTTWTKYKMYTESSYYGLKWFGNSWNCKSLRVYSQDCETVPPHMIIITTGLLLMTVTVIVYRVNCTICFQRNSSFFLC